MIAIIDYGAGNLFSVKNALDYIGEANTITDAPEDLRRADGLILPGVGAFPDAMRMLKESGLADAICKEAASRYLVFALVCRCFLIEGWNLQRPQGFL